MKIKVEMIVDFHGPVTPGQAAHLIKESVESNTWGENEIVQKLIDATYMHAEEVKE